MKYSFFLLAVLLKGISANLYSVPFDTDLSLEIGYRYDDLSWTVTSLPPSNILTEQKWGALQICQVTGKVEFTLDERFFFRAEGDYGLIAHGQKFLDERDLDNIVSFAEDGWLEAHTLGYVYDFSGGLGYVFPFFCNRFQCIPLVGYSYNVQHFNDGRYSDKVYMLNFFEDAESHYTYRWMGPWIGCCFSYLFENTCRASIEYQFHWNLYRGKINDNLTDNETELQKNNRIWGNDITLRLFSPCWKCWTIGLVGNYKFSRGTDGDDKFEHENFTLEKVSWRTMSITLSALRYF